MDTVRFGQGLRALRRRRGWTLERLAGESRTSRSAIQRIERGAADRVAILAVERVAAALGATVTVRLAYQGEALDRLLDSAHARLVEVAIGWLRGAGWEVGTEVSFNIRGERGSIDIIAFHAATRTLLVIEVKSAVPDLQAMIWNLDRKVRLGPEIARQRGWQPSTAARLLVLADDRTARRRVAEHAETFAAAFQARTVAVRRWVRDPAGPISGLIFLGADNDRAAPRHRVARRGPVGEHRSRQTAAVHPAGDRPDGRR